MGVPIIGGPGKPLLALLVDIIGGGGGAGASPPFDAVPIIAPSCPPERGPAALRFGPALALLAFGEGGGMGVPAGESVLLVAARLRRDALLRCGGGGIPLAVSCSLVIPEPLLLLNWADKADICEPMELPNGSSSSVSMERPGLCMPLPPPGGGGGRPAG